MIKAELLRRPDGETFVNSVKAAINGLGQNCALPERVFPSRETVESLLGSTTAPIEKLGKKPTSKTNGDGYKDALKLQKIPKLVLSLQDPCS